MQPQEIRELWLRERSSFGPRQVTQESVSLAENWASWVMRCLSSSGGTEAEWEMGTWRRWGAVTFWGLWEVRMKRC